MNPIKSRILINTREILQEQIMSFSVSNEIEYFFQKLAIDFLADKPQKISQIGWLEGMGVNTYNRDLNDYSIQAIYDRVIRTKENLKTLQQFDYNTLKSEQQLSYEIFSWWLQNDIEGEPFIFHDYPVNQTFGPLNDLSETFTRFHKLEKREDFEAYLERLTKISKQFEQIQQLILEQRNRGIVPPKFCLEKVIHSLQSFVQSSVKEHPFYHYFQTNIKILDSDTNTLKEKIVSILSTEVFPAYQQLIGFLLQFSKTIETAHGVSQLPQGVEYYAYCLKQRTTTNLTAEEIFQIGLEEVAKIQSEMRLLLKSVGIEDDQKTVGELMAQLAENEHHFFPNTELGKKACIEEFKIILKDSRAELSRYFGYQPDIPVTIVPTPEHQEENMPGAYYYEPSLDGSRPGTFYVNLRNMKELPKFGMKTLLVHEAEPGHHFQLTLQARAKIPLLRKLGEFNAFVEGWALYTEKLAYEKGFYTTAYDKLGHLQDELLRAVRLVVDPAIHTKKWSREQAIDYMQKQTGYKRETVVTEIERYFVMPGQACSYKIGQLKILELRKHAIEQLGSRFDIRHFHDVILETGACPLAVLEKVVDRYVNSSEENF